MVDVSVAACLWHASQVSATLHCHTGALPFAGQTIAACSSHEHQHPGQRVLDSKGQHVTQQEHRTLQQHLFKHLLHLLDTTADRFLQGQPLLDNCAST